MWSVIFSHSDMVLSPLCIFYNLGKNKVANVFKHTSKGSNIRRMFVGGEKKKKDALRIRRSVTTGGVVVGGGGSWMLE